jgi:mTERF domain-containing protein
LWTSTPTAPVHRFLSKTGARYESSLSGPRRDHVAAKIEYAEMLAKYSSGDQIVYDKALDMNTEALAENVEPELIDSISPALPKSFNLAAYADKSYTLQQLIKLGVNLAKLEAKIDNAQYILSLDFDQDMRSHIRFLVDAGVHEDNLGSFITAFPHVFGENIENLKTRLNYLMSKKFGHQRIGYILNTFPLFLSQTTTQIDGKLGLIQREFSLQGHQLRDSITRCPRLIQVYPMRFRMTNFILKEEFGFTKKEIKEFMVKIPEIVYKDRVMLHKNYDYLRREAGLTNQDMVRFPQILKMRHHLMRERHEYLRILGRDQFDPSKALYVPPSALEDSTDLEFCTKYAKTCLDDYHCYLKTL